MTFLYIVDNSIIKGLVLPRSYITDLINQDTVVTLKIRKVENRYLTCKILFSRKLCTKA